MHHQPTSSVLVVPLAILIILVCSSAMVAAQDGRLPVDDNGRVVNFARDVAPIFAAKCLQCHGPEEAKADFRIDDSETVVGSYIVAEDAAGSTLYADYLLSTEAEMMMPPPAHGGPLSPAEIAVIRTWIDEGAEWPNDATVAVAGAESDVSSSTSPVPQDAQSTFSRVWAFQGYFHPAAVHFPIALLSIGGLFVILGLKWPTIGTQVPLACLLIGSVSAVVATAMGWGFAPEKGYSGMEFGFERDIDAHRWSGTIVAGVSFLLAIIAIAGVKKNNRGLNFVWKAGLLGLALVVGLVGHQGGELTYGKTFYTKAFQRLMGTTEELVDKIEDQLP